MKCGCFFVKLPTDLVKSSKPVQGLPLPKTWLNSWPSNFHFHFNEIVCSSHIIEKLNFFIFFIETSGIWLRIQCVNCFLCLGSAWTWYLCAWYVHMMLLHVFCWCKMSTLLYLWHVCMVYNFIIHMVCIACMHVCVCISQKIMIASTW